MATTTIGTSIGEGLERVTRVGRYTVRHGRMPADDPGDPPAWLAIDADGECLSAEPTEAGALAVARDAAADDLRGRVAAAIRRADLATLERLATILDDA